MLDEVAGERLELDAYLDDFDSRLGAVHDGAVWKLERQQRFRQPESTSWTAFSQGHWVEALRLLESNRVGLADQFQQLAQARVSVQRVRVVEKPLVPYLQWELHSLHVRAQCGENIRVVGPAQVAPFEPEKPLPELVILGGSVLYKLVYTEQGILDGAVRFTDSELVGRCRGFIESLYESGEDLATFFARDVAGLTPPDGA